MCSRHLSGAGRHGTPGLGIIPRRAVTTSGPGIGRDHGRGGWRGEAPRCCPVSAGPLSCFLLAQAIAESCVRLRLVRVLGMFCRNPPSTHARESRLGGRWNWAGLVGRKFKRTGAVVCCCQDAIRPKTQGACHPSFNGRPQIGSAGNDQVRKRETSKQLTIDQFNCLWCPSKKSDAAETTIRKYCVQNRDSR